MWYPRSPRPANPPAGRDIPVPLPARHAVLGTPLDTCPGGMEEAVFGMGCFWGAEKGFWTVPGVHATAVGYAGGSTPNPTYEEVCSGLTGHAEVVRVVFDPARLSYETLLRVFWEGHDPTQGLRQGNDIGPQYRSCLHVTTTAQRRAAEASRDVYQRVLSSAGHGAITTEIIGPPDAPLPHFFPAEAYHQQYLAKTPGGYCGHGGTGLACPVGVAP